MNSNFKTGRVGETLAREYLEYKGYNILEQNWRYSDEYFRGEIDIIATRNSKIFFVEVKTRNNNNYGGPFLAVDKKKFDRLKKLAFLWHKANNFKYKSLSIDVLGISFLEHGLKLEHLSGVQL